MDQIQKLLDELENPNTQFERILKQFLSNWTWEDCKRAFPHNIDIATRLYRGLNGKEPEELL